MKQLSFPYLVLVHLLSTQGALSQTPLPPGNWKHVYVDQEFTDPVRLSDLDSVLFYRCTFRNLTEAPYALRLDRSTHVLIQECAFSDIQTNSGGRMLELIDCQQVVVDDNELWNHTSEGHSSAINMRGATSANITVQNNYIHDVAGNGVVSDGCSSCPDVYTHDSPNPGLRVLNNLIENVGLYSDPTGNSPKHGMYIKATDALIEGNQVFNSYDGVGITMRSTGVVRNNLVKNFKIGGIGGSFMKPAGPSATLLIENNVVIQEWNLSTPNYAHLISNICCSSYPKRYDNSIVRFNTAIAGSQINPSVEVIRVDSDDRRNNDRVYGNLMIDLRSSPSFWDDEENIEYEANNLFVTALDDLVDPENLDFRLQKNSALIGSITQEPDYPATDKAGATRTFPLTPGAYQSAAQVPPGDDSLQRVTIWARGTTGQEQVMLLADEVVIGEPVTLSTTASEYGWTVGQATRNLRVQFANDGSSAEGMDKNVWIDYLTVGQRTLQAEDQPINTGSWNEATTQCGGVPSEWLYCGGYVEFGLSTTNQQSAEAASLGPTAWSEWHLYPNPASDQLTVVGSQNYQVQLYDLTGRPLMQHDHLQGTVTLDVSPLRPGIYLLKVQDTDGTALQQRLIVQ